jgi:hypothetical protein
VVESPSSVMAWMLNSSTMEPACTSLAAMVVILLGLSTGGGVLRLWRYRSRKALAKILPTGNILQLIEPGDCAFR